MSLLRRGGRNRRPIRCQCPLHACPNPSKRGLCEACGRGCWQHAQERSDLLAWIEQLPNGGETG